MTCFRCMCVYLWSALSLSLSLSLSSNHCEHRRNLYSATRYAYLSSLMTSSLCKIYALPSTSLLLIHLQAGLAALKVRRCTTGCCCSLKSLARCNDVCVYVYFLCLCLCVCVCVACICVYPSSDYPCVVLCVFYPKKKTDTQQLSPLHRGSYASSRV